MTCRVAITSTLKSAAAAVGLKSNALAVCVDPDVYRVEWLGLWLSGGTAAPPDTFYSVLTTPQGATVLSTDDRPLTLPEGQ